ncbi:acyl-CoA dehydrogenase family protein [Rhodococcus artemisiae]|uniref:Acyl-CoA dehydrogenase family protein n=1 Tax=Rhodococcus artemisiae TaxID=714159 RepID=A0ABU7LC36_9NOCA|nr:acyl-CoA dehydrogenase family protein [Rhodococcus artemisiae]MEE2059120.1 acyl-CoA dehydrogenase family protein [Rhodococcus artemisiae]
MTTVTVDPILADTALQMFAEYCTPERLEQAEKSGWSSDLWSVLEASGLTRVGISESAGGSGGTPAEAAEMVRLAAYSSAPVPLAETVLLAGPLLEAAGLTLPDSALSVALAPGSFDARETCDEWTLTGSQANVPWARVSGHIVVLATSPRGPVVAVVPTERAQIVNGSNLAGEPRDTVTFRDVEIASEAGAVCEDLDADWWIARAAAMRSIQMAGALERAFELSVQHAKDRVQFGRPIASFQAVGQLIAVSGEAVAQARMAAETALASGLAEDAVIAKIIAGEAASVGAANAHQIHGAMGTTRECSLHWFTRRLWSWRDEFGTETYWARLIGRDLSHRDPASVWELITSNTERHME